MLGRLRGIWLRWRLPDRPSSADLFEEAATLHEHGYHAAAVMTARLAIESFVRQIAEKHSDRLMRATVRQGASVACVRLMQGGAMTMPEQKHVTGTVRKLSKVCHGAPCDGERAAVLLEAVERARRTLATVMEGQSCHA